MLALRKYLSRLHMNLLGYRYDYDRTTNESIVSGIQDRWGDSLTAPDDQQRRLCRTMAQYQAQLAMRPSLSKWLFECASFVALPFFVLAWRLAFSLQGGTRAKHTCDGVQLVFAERWCTNPEIFSVPDELASLTIVTRPLTRHRLSSSDLQLLWALVTLSLRQMTPFPFQLVLKCAVDMAAVRAAVIDLAPRFILVYWEFSCSLSAVTHAMAQTDIETYNVMHGDKHYYAKHAFFEVNRCYCWNTFYVDLFKDEFVLADFRRFTNPRFMLDEEDESYRSSHASKGIGIAAPHMATLAGRKDDLNSAAAQFANAVNDLAATHAVTIRPHPFYAEDFTSIKKYLSPQVIIEYPTQKSARIFLLDHTVIVGTVSTLLLEAAQLGCRVVIIDTPVMEDVKAYHYLYKMENVTTSTLNDLQAAITTIDDSGAVGQTDGKYA